MSMRYSSLQPWASSDIIDTDYENYAVMYTCTNVLGLYTFEAIWMLMKQPWDVGTRNWLTNAK